MVEDNKYSERIIKFRDMYLSNNPIPKLEEARILTERIIRKNGKQLRHNFIGESISTIELYYFDLLIAVIAFIIIFKKN